jgi:glyoxylase-like metal-dependent hydrolase (beta-lactamase superfamily II)
MVSEGVPVPVLRIGDVEITQVQEWAGELFKREQFLPESRRETWLDNQQWLVPDFWDPATEDAWTSSQTFALVSAGRKILVDTGIGNHKPRPTVPPFDRLNTDYLQKLTHAGFAPDSVDVVICTHLHPDHVGWNTSLQDGNWVPTFPNAQHLFHRADYEMLAALDPAQDAFGFTASLIDSVIPIIDSGLAHFWDGDRYDLTHEVHLLRMPGHSPGAAIIVVESGGRTAILSGDTVHHPMQILEPDQKNILDGDSGAAGASRRKVLTMAAERDAVVLAAHFPPPRAARIAATADGFAIAGWTALQPKA